MAAISNAVKAFFLRKSVLMRLILINAAVFVIVCISALLCRVLEVESPVRMLELPSTWSAAGLHIWSFVTYMFVHYDIFHILFNMLWLYCFGAIFLDLYSNRTFVVTYLAGGVTGAVFYLFASLIHPSAGLVGSSSAVLAIAAAAALRSPNYRINLFLLGMVKIKWVAAVCFVLFLFGANLSVGIAHLGGVLAGVFIALNAKYGWFDSGRATGHKRGVVLPPLHRSAVVTTEMTQAEVDKELDLLLIKVKKSGYNSLSVREKKELEELSRKLK